MPNTWLTAVPGPALPAVRTAIAAVFGAAGPADVTPILGGGSGARAWRLTNPDHDIVLRVEVNRDALRDPHRQYACMQIAAAAGVAPAVHFADPDAGVAAFDFIEVAGPVFAHTGGYEALVADLAAVLRRLHDGPAFPPLMTQIDGIRDLLPAVEARLTPGALDPHRAVFEQIAAAWRPEAVSVPSHHDLNPGNILYDGHRLWLIDWEGAYQDDPFIDLGCLANYFARTPEHGDLLLSTYLRREPTAAERAKLVLARQLVRMMYGVLLLSISLPEGEIARLEPGARLATIFQSIVEKRIDLIDASARKVFAEGYLTRLLEAAAAPEFEGALTALR